MPRIPHRFIVTVYVEEGSCESDVSRYGYQPWTPNHTETSDYVREAVHCWGGQLWPEHPFFGHNKRVTVKPYKEQDQ